VPVEAVPDVGPAGPGSPVEPAGPRRGAQQSLHFSMQLLTSIFSSAATNVAVKAIVTTDKVNKIIFIFDPDGF
jgi:hypothetical protein